MFGVRAVDDFGATSTAATSIWSFPAGYVPAPQQLEHSTVLPWGRQKILITTPMTIDAIYMWALGGPGSRYCCSQTYLNVFADSGGLPGEPLATSTSFTIDIYIGGGFEIYYTFNQPLLLAPGAYWFGPLVGPSQTTEGTAFFGSAGDAYPSGFWANDSGADTGRDAYFRLRQVLNP